MLWYWPPEAYECFVLQQPQYRQQVLNMQQLGAVRGQQQNAGGQPPPFDDVSSFDFLS